MKQRALDLPSLPNQPENQTKPRKQWVPGIHDTQAAQGSDRKEGNGRRGPHRAGPQPRPQPRPLGPRQDGAQERDRVSGGLAGEDVPAKLLHGPVTREIKGRQHPVSEDRSSCGPHAPLGRPARGVGVAYPRGPCLSPRRPGPSPPLGEESEDVAAAHLVLTLHSGS